MTQDQKNPHPLRFFIAGEHDMRRHQCVRAPLPKSRADAVIEPRADRHSGEKLKRHDRPEEV